ncbi:hypothetical protein [Kibdelosporangium phytohabitans]|uniref:ESX-1 secretion-associated protein n=1 Tax=Kibdelosporangium phytohabitans TaxID=860235 RepID=A0A0N9IG21_9PSEU|nr:hypothetical protein [Kibdelosporangium phytohabitans]ALG13842.1 hypothetical protein AOZ06_49485 [Kibdelosporangium phytohabitans]MBE1467229.1 phage-related protein [Kibdelosporangium phytohabitans]
MAGKTEIKPDEVRAVAADIEAMGAAFDEVVKFIGGNVLKPEHLGKVPGKSESAGAGFTTAVEALKQGLTQASGFIKGVGATLKSSADQHGGTEKASKQNLANADGGA